MMKPILIIIFLGCYFAMVPGVFAQTQVELTTPGIHIFKPDREPAIPLYYLGNETEIKLVAAITEYLSASAGLPPMLVVGVEKYSNGQLQQKVTEYSSGKKDEIMDFLTNELVPTVDNIYQTYPFRILAGHRQAGAYAFTTMMEKQDVFNAFILMSPTIYHIPEPELAMRTFLVNNFNWDDFLYIAQGFGDDTPMNISFEISRLLKAHSIERDIDYHFQLFDEVKNASLVTEAFPDALRKLFSDLDLAIMLNYGGITYLNKKTESLKEKYGFDPQGVKLPKIPVSRPLLETALQNPELMPSKFFTLWQTEKETYSFDEKHLANLYHYFQSHGRKEAMDELNSIVKSKRYNMDKSALKDHPVLNHYHDESELLQTELMQVVPLKGSPEKNLTLAGARVLKKPFNQIEFDGLDDYATIDSDKFSNLTGSFSVTTWINPASKERFEAFISQAVEGENKSHWRVGFGPMANSQWGLTVWNNAWKDYLVNYEVPADQWTHLGVVVDQSLGRVTYYVNGQAISVVEQVFPLFPTSEPVVLGRGRAEGGYFHGRLSAIHFYERGLSAREVGEIFRKEEAFIR